MAGRKTWFCSGFNPDSHHSCHQRHTHLSTNECVFAPNFIGKWKTLMRGMTLSAEAVQTERSTYADFECLDSVVQQQYIAHNLCVLPVSLQFRRPDIVGSASGQAEARAHHALTRICNKPREKEESANERSNRGKGTCLSFFIMHIQYMIWILVG